jgi:hypothetical protein
MDHVVALFRVRGLWGAISKTNHAVLRYRDPIYRTLRELALSYAHEYTIVKTGEKTLRSYAGPINLTRFDALDWMRTKKPLWEITEACVRARHYPIAPLLVLKKMRPLSVFERVVLDKPQWKRNGRLA